MQSFTEEFYRKQMLKSDKFVNRLLTLCAIFVVILASGIGLYFVTANDTEPVPKTCESFADYGEVQAWVDKHPEDFARLDAFERGLMPAIPCDTLYKEWIKNHA